MVDFTKRTAIEQVLVQYYEIYWLRIFNNTLYFLVEICLFVILTFLPIKLTFNYELYSRYGVVQNLDIVFLVIFALHIYLYLDHKVKKLVRNPQIKKKVLFKSHVVKLKWLSLFNIEFTYDILCFLVALFQIATENTNFTRALQLIYLFKIYKIKVFHDRFLTYIIGTPFYIIYNVFYGLFILIIIVSYVGCAFFQIDKILNDGNYQYPWLLWINVSAWPDIIDSGFEIQLLYTMYWSLGTASSAAYGNVSASSPPDIIYNILCLYFEGFLFGFYLSRIHSLPEILSKREDELLQIFEQFEQHKEQMGRGERKERIQKQLYFKILCSLQYQEYRKKNVNEIQKLIPIQYLIQIKTSLFQNMLHTNPLNLWHSPTLQHKLSLKISELTTEAGEQLYEYKEISQNDLIYIKEGTVTTSLLLDHTSHFTATYHNFQFFGLFQFVVNFSHSCVRAKCNNYSNLYFLRRSDYRQVLSMEEKIEFEKLCSKAKQLESPDINKESLGLYALKLAHLKSDVLFLSSKRKTEIVEAELRAHGHQRVFQKRLSLRAAKVIQRGQRSKSIGIQCSEDFYYDNIDAVIIF